MELSFGTVATAAAAAALLWVLLVYAANRVAWATAKAKMR